MLKSLALIAIVSIGIVGCSNEDDYPRQQSYNQQPAPAAAAPVIINQAAPSSGFSGSDVALGAIAGGLVGHAMSNNSRPTQQVSSNIDSRHVINKTVVNHIYNTPAPVATPVKAFTSTPAKVYTPAPVRNMYSPTNYTPRASSNYGSSRPSSNYSSMSSRSSSFSSSSSGRR